MFFPRREPMSPYDYHSQQYGGYQQPPYPNHPMYWQGPPHYEQHTQAPYPQHNQSAPTAGGAPPTPQAFQQYGRTKASISLANAFKNEDGQFDFEKTTNTIDQVLRVGGQISPLVKQVGSLFSPKA